MPCGNLFPFNPSKFHSSVRRSMDGTRIRSSSKTIASTRSSTMMFSNAYLQPGLGRLLIDRVRIGHTFFRPRNDEMRQHHHAEYDPYRPSLHRPQYNLYAG